MMEEFMKKMDSMLNIQTTCIINDLLDKII